MDNKLMSNTINFLRFPLTVAVVYIHFNISRKGISVHGINYGTDNPDWYTFVINLFSSVIASIAVPLFFLISGYLFFCQKNFNKEIYLSKLKKRIKTLLIPFILWNLIAILYQSIRFVPFFSSFFPGVYKTEVHLTLVRVLNTFFCCTLSNGIFVSPMEYTMTEIVNEPYPIDVPLWYIRDLMVAVIMSPVIYLLIKRFQLLYIFFMGFLWYLRNLFFPTGGYIILLITSLTFFSWGAYYAINRKDLIERMRKMKYYLLLYIPIALCDTILLYSEYSYLVHNLGVLLGVMVVFVISAHFVEVRVTIPPKLRNATFFVFAFHKLIIDDVAKMVFSVLHLPDDTYIMLLLYFIIPIMTIGVCIFLYQIINKFLPTACGLLTGGR